MRAAGAPPAFPHLRALCTYPDERFAAWFERVVAAASPPPPSPPGKTSTLTTPTPRRPPRGRRLRGVGDPPRPSVRTTSLAELGISYAVSGGSSSSSRRAAAAATVAATAVTPNTEAVAQEVEACFAPGRADAKLLVRKLSQGLDVLDLCCGTGGFALNAAAGKARSVLGVRSKEAGGAVRGSAGRGRLLCLDHHLQQHVGCFFVLALYCQPWFQSLFHTLGVSMVLYFHPAGN